MGNSLHNKIYLGRRAPVFGSRRMQALFILGAVASAGLVWLALRSYD